MTPGRSRTSRTRAEEGLLVGVVGVVGAQAKSDSVKHSTNNDSFILLTFFVAKLLLEVED